MIDCTLDELYILHDLLVNGLYELYYSDYDKKYEYRKLLDKINEQIKQKSR